MVRESIIAELVEFQIPSSSQSKRWKENGEGIRFRGEVFRGMTASRSFCSLKLQK